MQPILETRELTKIYETGAGSSLPVLNGVNASIAPGEFVTIMGVSGSGKSTLLHLMGALDAPSTGQVLYNGDSIEDLKPHQRDQLRCREFGFVFQSFHLLPELDVLANVMFPMMVQFNISNWLKVRHEQQEYALELLTKVGLQERAGHMPNQLSGGEKQRVAIARALANKPAVLLADEPTGNLDKHTGHEVLGLLQDLHSRGQTLVMVTHDSAVAATADRILHLEDGIIDSVQTPATQQA